MDAWLERALAAETRAASEAARRLRAERLAEHGPERLRELYRDVARVHRLTEERHRVTARLHRSLVRQLSSRREGLGISRLVVTAISDVCGCPSSAILLVAGDGSTAESVGTDNLASDSQDLEIVHGEGPLHAAWASGEQVEEDARGAGDRWPHYAARIEEIGLRTVVAAPLRQGPTLLGAVGIFNPAGPDLRPPLAQLARGAAGLVLAAVAGDQDLRGRAISLDGTRDLHQAAGVVAVETGCDVENALVLIRARAFATEESVATVARRILDGELHLSL